MATLSRAALKADQAAKWPNNDTNAITPQRLRQPVIDVVDSAPNIVDDGRVIVKNTITEVKAHSFADISTGAMVRWGGKTTQGDGMGDSGWVDKSDTTTAGDDFDVIVASDGTRIKTYRKTRDIALKFNSVAEMLVEPYAKYPTMTRVELLGYYAAGDGGGQLLYVDKADTTTAENGGTVFVANDGTRLKRTFSGACNVRWFGAKGDGVTNDYLSITASISFVSDMGGGKVYFPKGTYLSNSSIVIPNTNTEVLLIGDGSRNSIIKSGIVSATPTALIYAAGDITNRAYTQLSDISLQGNSAANVHGIYSYYGTPSSSFRNLLITGFIDGIRIGRNYLTSLYNVQSIMNYNGIVIGYDIYGSQAVSNNINIYGGQFSSNSNYGMSLYGLRTAGIYGGDIENNGVAGIFASYCFGLKVSSVYSESSLITHMTDAHYVFDNCRGVILTSCNVSNWYAGNKLIRIKDTSGARVSAFNCELGIGSTTIRSGTAIQLENTQGCSVDACELDNIQNGIVIVSNGRVNISTTFFNYVTTPVTIPDQSYSNAIWNAAYDTDVTASSFGASCRVIATQQNGTTFRKNWTA